MEEEHEPKTEQIPEAAEFKEESNNSEPTEVVASSGNHNIIEDQEIIKEKNEIKQDIIEEKNKKNQEIIEEKNKKISEKGKQPAQKIATNGIKKTNK